MFDNLPRRPSVTQVLADMRTVGARLKYLVTEAGWDQKRLSEVVGISADKLSHLINHGKTLDPDLVNLIVTSLAGEGRLVADPHALTLWLLGLEHDASTIIIGPGLTAVDGDGSSTQMSYSAGIRALARVAHDEAA
jgi:predicted XRE-type DNA-binding protein